MHCPHTKQCTAVFKSLQHQKIRISPKKSDAGQVLLIYLIIRFTVLIEIRLKNPASSSSGVDRIVRPLRPRPRFSSSRSRPWTRPRCTTTFRKRSTWTSWRWTWLLFERDSKVTLKNLGLSQPDFGFNFFLFLEILLDYTWWIGI